MPFSPEDHQKLLTLRPQLVAFARSLVNNHAMAEDLCQETLNKALKHQDSFKSGTNMKAWTFMILRNQFYTDRRRSSKQVEFSSSETAEHIFNSRIIDGGQEYTTELNDALEQISYLPEEQRNALLLAMAGFSLEEMAESLDVPVGTVKSRVSRGRTALREYQSGEKKPILPPLNIWDIVNSARATLNETGQRPYRNSGKVKFGSLKDKASWEYLDRLIADHARNNPKQGYNNLQTLLDFRKVPYDLATHENIIASADATFAATDSWPTENDKQILYGPLAHKDKWKHIDRKLKFLHSHNAQLPSSLDDLLARRDHFIPPIQARDIFNAMTAHMDRYRVVPPFGNPEFKIGDFKVGTLVSAFTVKAVRGLEEFTPENKLLPETLQEFMLVANLASIKNERLVPVLDETALPHLQVI